MFIYVFFATEFTYHIRFDVTSSFLFILNLIFSSYIRNLSLQQYVGSWFLVLGVV